MNNHKELPGFHRSWVEHILLFIVPRQIVELGDPTRRSCDACETLGARFKKIIKHLTARNHLRPGNPAAQRRATSTRTGLASSWERIFTVGYIEQAFTRLIVEESLRHGEENEQYLLREDVNLRQQGIKGVKKEKLHGPRMAITAAVAAYEAQADEDAGVS